MDSKIYLNDVVDNKERKFGANPQYVCCEVVFEDGRTLPSMFTFSNIEIAIDRANKNKEDIPKHESWWCKLFG
jgi:hypothetical protein